MRAVLCFLLLGLALLARADDASAPASIIVTLAPAQAPRKFLGPPSPPSPPTVDVADYELTEVPASEAKDKKTIPVVTYNLPQVTKDKLSKKLNVTKPSIDVVYEKLLAPPPPPTKKAVKKEVVDHIKEALPPVVMDPVVNVQAPSQQVAVSGAPVTVSGVPVVEAPPPKVIPVVEKVIKVPELLPTPVLNLKVPKLALAPKAVLVPEVPDKKVVASSPPPAVAVSGAPVTPVAQAPKEIQVPQIKEVNKTIAVPEIVTAPATVKVPEIPDQEVKVPAVEGPVIAIKAETPLTSVPLPSVTVTVKDEAPAPAPGPAKELQRITRNLLQELSITQVPVPAPELVAGDFHFVPVGSTHTPTQLPDVPKVPSMAPSSVGTPSLAASG